MAMPAVGAPMAACGSMPGVSTWCIPEPVSPSAWRRPCPGKARLRGHSPGGQGLPGSGGGGFRNLSADPGAPPRWGPAGLGPRRCGAAGDRRAPLPWRVVPVPNGAGWARGSPPGRGGPGPWGCLGLWSGWSVWSWWWGECPHRAALANDLQTACPLRGAARRVGWGGVGPWPIPGCSGMAQALLKRRWEIGAGRGSGARALTVILG